MLPAPLEGIRVIEVAHFVAAPSAGALLADLGAEVIKVEVPEGEIYRHVRPAFAGIDSDFDASPGFQLNNRGKRSLALDLKQPESVDALHRVIDTADVLLTNTLPDRRPRFRLDAEGLLGRKPDLIYASLTGYGSKGADASTPAFDYAAYWARTGLMDLMHDQGTPPAFLRPGLGDHAAGLSLVTGILSALRVKERTGRGQYIDVSLMGVGLYVSGCDTAMVAATGKNPPRHVREAPSNPLWNQYRTADDRWLFLVMVESDRYWPLVARAVGRERWLEDARFRDAESRAAHSAELVGELDAVFATETLAAWEGRLAKAGLIWAPARTMAEALQDEQVAANGYTTPLEEEVAGRFDSIAPPFSLSEHTGPSGRAAPRLGADTDDVLRSAGLSDDEIARIRRADP